MKSRTGSSRVISLIAITILVLTLCVPVFAIERFDENRDVSVTLVCKTENGVPLGGEAFYMYKVAEMSQDMHFTLCGSFVDANIEFTDMTAQKWAEAAIALDSFVEENNILPMSEGVTDEEGRLTFTPETKSGLYLIRGASLRLGNEVYYPIPFLVALPSLNVDGSDWVYSPEALVKYEKVSEPQPELIDVTVVKVWSHDDPNARPGSVTVALYAGTLFYEEVTLSADNNWTHTWEGLDKNATWRIVETNVPDGYTPSVVVDGQVFTVTNTGHHQEPTPPKTGDYNNILPLAIVAGVSLICASIVTGLIKKKSKREEY